MPSVDGSAARDFALGVAPFRYADLYDPERLADLSLAFDEFLTRADAALAAEFIRYRGGEVLSAPDVSDLLIRAGAHLGRFVELLFAIGPDAEKIRDRAKKEEVLFSFKRDFI